MTDHDVAEHDAFDLCHRQPIRPDFVELLLFQRGEEALNPRVVIAAAPVPLMFWMAPCRARALRKFAASFDALTYLTVTSLIAIYIPI